MKFNSRNALIPTLSRVSPVLLILITLLNCIVNPGYHSVYLFVVMSVSSQLNWTIKHLIAKPIYNLLKTDSLPILGIGKRPKGANSCQFILDNTASFSYGMPSGHSQLIWTMGTYIICKIINNWINSNNYSKLDSTITILEYIWLAVSCCIVLLSMLYVSYSRVYIEGCHTIQQVVVGGILGIATGFVVYYYENDVINNITK